MKKFCNVFFGWGWGLGLGIGGGLFHFLSIFLNFFFSVLWWNFINICSTLTHSFTQIFRFLCGLGAFFVFGQ